MISMHGNVTMRPALPHVSYPRYIALLDVLGMKAWVERDSATTIAEALDVALAACGQSSSGTTSEGITYGPLIEVMHFSDSLLVWSPDDSWASLGALCSSLKMIVGVALTEGVPLRGSVAHGDVVCNQSTLKFVGQPIVEAYLWAEKDRPYKSVGVDLTPQTISKLIDRHTKEPIPSHWQTTLNERVIRHELEGSEGLIWHADCLFINHWNHGMISNCDPEAMFLMRNLPVSIQEKPKIAGKVHELQEFYAHHQLIQSRQVFQWKGSDMYNTLSPFEDFKLQQADYVQLNNLRKVRT